MLHITLLAIYPVSSSVSSKFPTKFSIPILFIRYLYEIFISNKIIYKIQVSMN